MRTLWLCLFLVGCSQHVETTQRVLSSNDAAQLAAKLANDKCENLYRRRPFRGNQYLPKLEKDEYHWGHLNVAGEGGFSALVTFRGSGENPRVEIYFSTDVF